MPNSQSPSGPHFMGAAAAAITDSVYELENKRKVTISAMLPGAPPSPREVRRKVAQFRRIKKDLAVHVKETLIVLDYILRAVFPITKFNEGGERFLYTVAVF